MNIDVPYTSFLDIDGNLKEGAPQLSHDDLKTIYWHMNLGRICNAKILSMQKQGRIGTYASTLGQEGCQAALAHAIKDNDNIWLVPSFRESVATIARGYPMEQLMRYWGGFEIGSNQTREFKVMPVNIPIASQLNHAAGIAISMKFKGEKGAAIGFVGDGGTSEGEFAEAMNFVGEFKAPAVFVCQNNQYAISVPRKKQTAASTIAQKATAFGFEGVQVDGNDVFACYKIIKDAIEKAMNGGGPTFVEAITYRLDNHTTADDWHKYRTEEEVNEWKKKDPIERLKKHMMQIGCWDDQHEQHMLEDAKKKVEEAAKAYEGTPKPKVEEIFDHLYAKLPYHIQEQKDHFVKFWGGQ
ncbi:pyruvate dehydrogenase (acetyl-transferring) E1 component subunit alpha [Candidatus Woesearchaeota archaeon]|nr:pyruvate dehydrogenase (acetyl-transferring) E1 component subunit alpha [Candidatus Woesearchaeota archaeon]